MKTVRESLAEAVKALEGVDTPFLDASLLLAHAAGITREKLLASYPEELPTSIVQQFHEYIEKRLSGYPVSYIRHKKEFFGLPFYVDERVLVPRPETESLVELVLEQTSGPSCGETSAAALPKGKDTGTGGDGGPEILDLGTGSGCIAITLKYLHPELQVTAADVSSAALEVCALNSRHLLTEDLPMVESDLFSSIRGEFDIIVSNPPYLTEKEVRNMEEKHWPEPRAALAGGPDGLDLVRRLIGEGFFYLKKGGRMYIEVGIEQISAAKALFLEKGSKNVTSYCDLSGRDRVVSGSRPNAE
jgi:release factor glutamine methyltransferase